MSGKNSAVPDAWDDDWEIQADKPPSPEAKKPSKISKAERRAQQAEFNRQLWAEADAERRFNFLDARGVDVPLAGEFKPAIQVLSRKLPTVASRSTDPNSAQLAGLGLNDKNDDDDSSSDSGVKEETLTAEQRQERARKAREEKERKYKEVRERLFGTSSSTAASGTSSPGTITPPTPKGENGGGGRRRNRGGPRERGSRPSSSAGRGRQLYDPAYTAKPDSPFGPRRGDCRNGSPKEQEPIRSPKGPDGSGRGGFGFGGHRGRGAS
ncbi:MAG: hypothetical protein M1834_001800 [Cirrosporium novae-zelandiae]|nr:MAG: hypothetical protein M1834_001800 [Cirrosporium novae-zelandiae]